MEKPKIEVQGTQWAGSCSVFFLTTGKGQLKIMLSSKEGKFTRTEFYINQDAEPNIVEICIYAISSKTDVWVLLSDTKTDSDLLSFTIYPSE